MTYKINLQLASSNAQIPQKIKFREWTQAVLKDIKPKAEVTFRIVDKEESVTLNKTYRQKDKATNVLSFPFEAPQGLDIDFIGDIVICAPLVAEEAREQDKEIMAHWAHLTIHSLLHLVGFDHVNQEQAKEMETQEIKILNELGFMDPYREPVV